MLNNYLSIFITIVVAWMGGYFLFATFAWGLLLGAMTSVIVLNMLTKGGAYMPFAARFIGQVIIGAYLGFSLRSYNIGQIFRLIPMVVIILTGMIIMGTLIAVITTRITDISPVTAMIAAMPGGISEAPIIALDMKADPTSVTALQFVRLVAGIGIFPLLIKLTTNTSNPVEHPQVINPQSIVPSKPESSLQATSMLTGKNQALGLVVASVGGVFGNMLDFPASIIICSMAFVSLLKPLGSPIQVPKSLMQAAQLLIGAYIGCTVNYQDLYHLNNVILPAIILIVVFGINCILTSLILNRISKVNIRTALLMSSPAGGSEMALIAADMGSSSTDITDIVLVHILRVIIIIVIYPPLVLLISKLM